jgi:hypothetical protein
MTKYINIKIFANENISGIYASKASEDSLAKNWLLAEEKVWDNLKNIN